MNDEMKKKISEIFEKYPSVKLAYFFGSRADGDFGPMSDYDFAIFFDERDEVRMFETKFLIMDELSRILGTDDIDLVILNLAQSSEIKYRIIKDGENIYEKDAYSMIVEPKILNEYFDYHQMMIDNNLTKSRP